MWILGEDDEGEIPSDQEQEVSNVEDEAIEPVKEDPSAKKGESVRESLKRALKQGSDEGEVVEDTTEEESESDKDSSGKEEIKKADTKEVKEPKAKIAPPIGWTKAAKAQWDKLPPEVQESVAKREQEASDGFKTYGEKVKDFETRVKGFEELDNVFKPREQELQRMGVSKAQVVDQMFQWIEAFANPDKNYAKAMLVKLGKNYGINFDAAPSQQTQENKTPAEGENNSQVAIPAELQQVIDQVTGKVTSLETTIQKREREEQERKQRESNEFLNNWSKDKPHFQKVRQTMYALLQSGAIPLKDGNLDLDSAYNQAVYANPELRELVLKEEAEKKATADKAEREKKELQNRRKVEKAKNASSSISTRAPTGVSKPNQGKNGKPPSVRDSIKASIQEMRENS